MEELLGIGSRVRHPQYGDGAITKLNFDTYDVCFMLYGVKQIDKDYVKWEIVEHLPAEDEVNLSPLEIRLEAMLMKWNGIEHVAHLGDKWEGGNMLLQPKDLSLKPKEVPIETFFHKIVMLRDRLRVLEQKINANTKLTEFEKIEMQQYITRVYGSLTTFNVLFKLKEDYFVGDSSKD